MYDVQVYSSVRKRRKNAADNSLFSCRRARHKAGAQAGPSRGVCRCAQGLQKKIIVIVIVHFIYFIKGTWPVKIDCMAKVSSDEHCKIKIDPDTCYILTQPFKLLT
jgi:hypothetical protein